MQAVRLPPLYLPPAECLHQLRSATVIYLDISSNWQKQSLRNRTRIFSANGPCFLSIPVQHTGGVPTPFREIRISYAQPWIKIHTGALSAAYNTSPFFPYFKDEIFACYAQRPVHLWELNLLLLQCCLRKLKWSIPVEIWTQQSFDEDLSEWADFRQFQTMVPPYPFYSQVFSYKFPYEPYLNLVDLLANKGGW